MRDAFEEHKLKKTRDEGLDGEAHALIANGSNRPAKGSRDGGKGGGRNRGRRGRKNTNQGPPRSTQQQYVQCRTCSATDTAATRFTRPSWPVAISAATCSTAPSADTTAAGGAGLGGGDNNSTSPSRAGMLVAKAGMVDTIEVDMAGADVAVDPCGRAVDPLGGEGVLRSVNLASRRSDRPSSS